MTRKGWDDPDKNQIAAGQRAVAKFMGKTYKEIRAAALRSYKRLEKDFVKFRREVIDSRDEVFEEKIVHV